MTIGAEASAVNAIAGGGGAPHKLSEQIDYLFAQQLMHVMTETSNLSPATEGTEGEEGASYMGLLGDHLAKQIAHSGALGIGQHLIGKANP